MSGQKNSVFTKILELRKKVMYLKKNTKSFNYSYVNGSNVLGVVKPIMNDLGLVLFPNTSNTKLTHVMYTKPKTNKEGEPLYDKNNQLIMDTVSEYVVQADITFTWVDEETGDQYSHTMFGAGSDPDPSKAEGKMYTYMERYHLLKTLNIATDKDDPDAYMNTYLKKHQEDTEREALIAEFSDLRKEDEEADKVISQFEINVNKKMDFWKLEKLVGLKGYLEKLRDEKEQAQGAELQ